MKKKHIVYVAVAFVVVIGLIKFGKWLATDPAVVQDTREKTVAGVPVVQPNAAPQAVVSPGAGQQAALDVIQNPKPDVELKAELMGQGYNPVFADEVLQLRSMLKSAGIKAEDIRNANLGGREARENFSKSLPPRVQMQMVKTLRAMIAPGLPPKKSE